VLEQANYFVLIAEGAAITLAEKVRLFSYATSLGHAHSLLFHYPTDLYVDAAPYLSDTQKARIREWMGEGIMRASIGLEHPHDLIADLDQALRAHVQGPGGAVGLSLDEVGAMQSCPCSEAE
jgi:cystathionine beta-lyase/cystathionine gamma-synthase